MLLLQVNSTSNKTAEVAALLRGVTYSDREGEGASGKIQEGTKESKTSPDAVSQPHDDDLLRFSLDENIDFSSFFPMARK